MNMSTSQALHHYIHKTNLYKFVNRPNWLGIVPVNVLDLFFGSREENELKEVTIERSIKNIHAHEHEHKLSFASLRT